MMDSIEFTAAGSRFYHPAEKGAILCQFTGLTDGNAKEVFVHDVLTLHGSLDYWDVVEFHRGEYCLIRFKHPNNEGIGRLGHSIRDISRQGYVIIGNRWEPAEALRKRVIEMQIRKEIR